MIPDFETALADLLDRYSDTPTDEVISALELRLMAFREQHAEETEEEG